MNTLSGLGWIDFFASQLTDLEHMQFTVARVVADQRGIVRIRGRAGGEWIEWLAELAGRLVHESDERPVAGDWVLARTGSAHDRAQIVRILARRTKISRKAAGTQAVEQVLAANVDTVAIVTSLNQDLNPRRLERYLLVAWESGAQPLVVLAKGDLCPNGADGRDAAVAEIAAVAPGVPVLALSAVTGEGLDALAAHLVPGSTTVLVGSSGVGKSTLLNRLAGQEAQRVHEIREDDDRGRHTTTNRALFALENGAFLIDTPGMRELAPWEGETAEGNVFQEIATLASACRFRDCAHEREPGCAVAAAISEGTLDPARFGSYRRLHREQERLDNRKNKAARAAERRKWRTIHLQARARRKAGFDRP